MQIINNVPARVLHTRAVSRAGLYSCTVSYLTVGTENTETKHQQWNMLPTVSLTQSTIMQ